MIIPSIRVGQGYDSHAFIAGDHLMIGGVRIPFDRGLRAHSDGDVLLHALIDALLGAAALGDIGHYFPDTDPQWENASSIDLLTQVISKLTESNWIVGNVDATVITERPKLKPYLPDMKAKMAHCLGCESTVINVKATTNEKMGWIGRGEGIAALVVVTILQASHHVLDGTT